MSRRRTGVFDPKKGSRVGTSDIASRHRDPGLILSLVPRSAQADEPDGDEPCAVSVCGGAAHEYSSAIVTPDVGDRKLGIVIGLCSDHARQLSEGIDSISWHPTS